MVNFKPETDEYLANTTSFFSTYTKMSKICPLSKASFLVTFWKSLNSQIHHVITI